MKVNRKQKPAYGIRKHISFWAVDFKGQTAVFDHEQGAFYVAYLLLNPPSEPIHGLALEVNPLPSAPRDRPGPERQSTSRAARIRRPSPRISPHPISEILQARRRADHRTRRRHLHLRTSTGREMDRITQPTLPSSECG